MKPIGCCVLSLAMLACEPAPAAFRPTEAVRAQGRGGQPAASYDVRDEAGVLAVANVWSEGAYVAEDDSATLVRVVLQVKNTGAVELKLDGQALELLAFDTAGASLGAARLVAVIPPGAPPSIAAASGLDIDCLFALPRAVLPESLGGLRFRWALLKPDGGRYLQLTDFTRDLYRSGPAWGYAPVYGTYDPFFMWRGPEVRVRVHHHVPVRRIFVPHRHHR